MTGAALALVLTAAASHAFWNALAKRARNPLVFLWSSVTLATAALAVPALLVADGGQLRAGAPFLVATIVLHAFYFYALSSSYGAGDFSRVYPIARGLGVALVPVVAYVLFAFRLSKAGYVVAARELSILFSALFGSLWLGEGRLGPLLSAAVVVLAGVVCVALAR